MRFFEAFFCLSVLPIAYINGYSQANFGTDEATACLTRIPGHYGLTPQTGPPPYTLTVSASSYQPGDVLTLTLEGTGGNSFKGFLLQAVLENDNDVRVGTFTPVAQSKLNCPTYGSNTITHDSGVEKTSISFTWTAPDPGVGNIKFIYTVVKSYLEVWVNIESTIVTNTILGPTPAPTPAPTQQAIAEIDFTECGLTKSCYRQPDNCDTDCDFAVTWKLNGQTMVDIEVQGVMASSQQYIAVGLSLDQSMGSDSVMDCIYTGQDPPIEIQMSYNADVGRSNSPLTNKYLGLVEGSQEGYYDNGKLICRYTRLVSLANTADASDPEADKVYNLDGTYTILMAKGAAPSGIKTQHTNRIISPSQVTMTSGTYFNIGVQSGTAPPQQPIAEIDFTECGLTKSCYRLPENCDMDCEFAVTWKLNGQTMVDIEVQGVMASNQQYIAVGLSLDQSMGSDSVMDCIYTGQDPPIEIQMSYNADVGRSNSPLTDKYLGLVENSREGYFSNGRLICRYTRLVSLTSTADASNTEANKVYSLDGTYTILMAKGVVQSGFKNQHAGTSRIISPSQVTMASGTNVNIGGSTKGSPLIKVHGIVMILAWMVCASFGILMPRYCKSAWPDRKCADKPVWFMIHMSVMVCTFFLTVTGFIIIFVSAKGYADQPSLPQKAHPPLGIITTILVIINPIMAAFRPHPGTPKRPIFNWAHFIVGLLAHICATASIFIAMYFDSYAPRWGKWVVVAFIVWQVLMELILTVHQRCCMKVIRKDRYQMKNVAMPEDPKSEPDVEHGTGPKTFLVCLHLMGVIALALALIIPIGQA